MHGAAAPSIPLQFGVAAVTTGRIVSGACYHCCRLRPLDGLCSGACYRGGKFIKSSELAAFPSSTKAVHRLPRECTGGDLGVDGRVESANARTKYHCWATTKYREGKKTVLERPPGSTGLGPSPPPPPQAPYPHPHNSRRRMAPRHRWCLLWCRNPHGSKWHRHLSVRAFVKNSAGTYGVWEYSPGSVSVCQGAGREPRTQERRLPKPCCTWLSVVCQTYAVARCLPNVPVCALSAKRTRLRVVCQTHAHKTYPVARCLPNVPARAPQALPAGSTWGARAALGVPGQRLGCPGSAWGAPGSAWGARAALGVPGQRLGCPGSACIQGAGNLLTTAGMCIPGAENLLGTAWGARAALGVPGQRLGGHLTCCPGTPFFSVRPTRHAVNTASPGFTQVMQSAVVTCGGVSQGRGYASPLARR
eukprot:gene7943-biopygen21102